MIGSRRRLVVVVVGRITCMLASERASVSKGPIAIWIWTEHVKGGGGRCRCCCRGAARTSYLASRTSPSGSSLVARLRPLRRASHWRARKVRAIILFGSLEPSGGRSARLYLARLDSFTCSPLHRLRLRRRPRRALCGKGSLLGRSGESRARLSCATIFHLAQVSARATTRRRRLTWRRSPAAAGRRLPLADGRQTSETIIIIASRRGNNNDNVCAQTQPIRMLAVASNRRACNCQFRLCPPTLSVCVYASRSSECVCVCVCRCLLCSAPLCSAPTLAALACVCTTRTQVAPLSAAETRPQSTGGARANKLTLQTFARQLFARPT